jgi:hypothetical protein
MNFLLTLAETVVEGSLASGTGRIRRSMCCQSLAKVVAAGG